jgi:hypothetical protein
MSVALKIKLANGAVKTMRFTSEMSVSEACDQIFEKTNEGDCNSVHAAVY